MQRRAWRAGCFLLALTIALGGCSLIPGLTGSPATETQTGVFSTAPTAAATQPEESPKEIIDSVLAENRAAVQSGTLRFELPISGASGYTAVATDIYESTPFYSGVIGQLAAGECFRIQKELINTWQIQTASGAVGYINNRYCFINLADILPSVVYRISNSSSSLFRSAGKDIPGVTGEQLYNTKCFNERFGREQFVVPVLYSMADRIFQAQQAALADGNTLVIYETYRPFSVQKFVGNRLRALMQADSEVRLAVNEGPWNMSWFIGLGISNHQRGCAMDVGLAAVDRVSAKPFLNTRYLNITGYTEYAMQSPMHELSARSVSMTRPIDDNSNTAWRKATVNPLMTPESLLLKQYCTDAGLSPLASEWWHFNDLNSIRLLGNNFSTDDYDFSVCLSRESG